MPRVHENVLTFDLSLLIRVHNNWSESRTNKYKRRSPGGREHPSKDTLDSVRVD